MKITSIKTLWPENMDFKMVRENTGRLLLLAPVQPLAKQVRRAHKQHSTQNQHRNEQ